MDKANLSTNCLHIEHKTIIDSLCLGCRFCSISCPFKQRFHKSRAARFSAELKLKLAILLLGCSVAVMALFILVGYIVA